jgi:hypothetical protein
MKAELGKRKSDDNKKSNNELLIYNYLDGKIN